VTTMDLPRRREDLEVAGSDFWGSLDTEILGIINS
jgi:hypothetical protein